MSACILYPYPVLLLELIIQYLHIACLEICILSDNDLSGPIPSTLGLMTSMEELWISNNNLITGTIPEELGNLTNLYTLHLEETSLEGTMPPKVCLLRENNQSLEFPYNLYELAVDCKDVDCCCCSNCQSDIC